MDAERLNKRDFEAVQNIEAVANRFNDLVEAYCCEGKIGTNEQIEAHVIHNKKNLMLLFTLLEVIENSLNEKIDEQRRKFLQRMRKFIEIRFDLK